MSIETKSDGRELMVQYTCQRCRGKVVLPYDKVMHGEHYGYLRNSDLPDGWQPVGYNSILCARCYEEYKAFMNPIEKVEKHD